MGKNLHSLILMLVLVIEISYIAMHLESNHNKAYAAEKSKQVGKLTFFYIPTAEFDFTYFVSSSNHLH